MTLRGAVFRYTLALEAAGFLLIIAIIWLDEILDLPRLLFDTPATPFRPGEGLLESALALAVERWSSPSTTGHFGGSNISNLWW